MKNIMEKIEKAAKTINPHYGMRWNEGLEIMSESSSALEGIANGFRFGYMQGVKAAKAEMKKGGRAV